MYNNKHLKVFDKEDILGKKVILHKPRAIIHSYINKIPSKREKELYNYILKKAKEQLNYLSAQEEFKRMIEKWKNNEFTKIISFYLSISELKKIFKDFKHLRKKEIYETFKELEEIKLIKINLLEKDTKKEIIIQSNSNKIPNDIDFDQVTSVDIIRIISNVKIDYTNDIVSFYLPPISLAYLVAPKMYTNLNLLILNYLSSSYSITLFEFLHDFYENQKRFNQNKDFFETGKISLTKLRQILGAYNKYSRYTDFKKWVLNPAIKELNKSDVVPFFIEFQEIKKGKKVEWINFIMEDKPEYLKSDVILTKKGPQKITYEEKKFQNPSDKYPVKKELLELKEKIKNGLPYIIFKRELMKIQNSYICNKIDGYQPHLILKTNNIGHLEIYNPHTKEIRQLDKIKDAKELEELRQFLYKNSDRIGGIQYIDEKEIHLEELKSNFLNRYYHFTKDNFHYIILIKDIQFKDNEHFVLNGNDIIEDIKDIKITYPISTKEKIISLLKNEIKDDEIAYYQDLNRL